jgi:hypothetical protein
MWKELWNKWTIDKPAALGDWLWDVFVVQLAALLDRLTLRKIIALIPVVILILAYAHRIPIPPELMLVGDLLAYIDIFSVLFLLGVLSSAATILFVVKRATRRAARLVTGLPEGMRRLDFRHRRESGAKNRKRLTDRGKDDDDRHVVIRPAGPRAGSLSRRCPHRVGPGAGHSLLRSPDRADHSLQRRPAPSPHLSRYGRECRAGRG